MKRRVDLLNNFQKHAWNDKNLDYEIETMVSFDCAFTGFSLKRQEPRLRDWNMAMQNNPMMYCYYLETTRTSITRLKHGDAEQSDDVLLLSWNDKNLDYEIETWYIRGERNVICSLETTRTSITRLKRLITKDDSSASPTWNDKNLDYEIETLPAVYYDDIAAPLKRQEPRLRDWNLGVGNPQGITFDGTWNDKNLDYEIETDLSVGVRVVRLRAWNDKNLDYEIETM